MGAYIRIKDPGLIPWYLLDSKSIEQDLTVRFLHCMDVVPEGVSFIRDHRFVKIAATFERTDHVEYLRSMSRRVLDPDRYGFYAMQLQVAYLTKSSGGDKKRAQSLLVDWLEKYMDPDRRFEVDREDIFKLSNRDFINRILSEGRVPVCK